MGKQKKSKIKQKGGNVDKQLPQVPPPQQLQQQIGILSKIYRGGASEKSIWNNDITNKYTIERSLGKGGFKKAYLVHDKSNEKFVLFKLQDGDDKDDYFRNRTIENIGKFEEYFKNKCEKDKCKNKCSNTLVICPVEMGVHNGVFAIVTNMFTGDNLHYFLKKNRTSCDILQLFLEILRGLRDLHKMEFIHFDIKPANIMIHKKDGKFHVGIIDVDTGCFINNIDNCIRYPVYTPEYTNETYTDFLWYSFIASDKKEVRYLYNFDIYSLGIIFKEILKKNNVNTNENANRLQQIVDNMAPIIKDDMKLTDIRNLNLNLYKNVDEIITDIQNLQNTENIQNINCEESESQLSESQLSESQFSEPISLSDTEK